MSFPCCLWLTDNIYVMNKFYAFCVSSFDPKRTFQFYVVSLYIIGAVERENTCGWKQASYPVCHLSEWFFGTQGCGSGPGAGGPR